MIFALILVSVSTLAYGIVGLIAWCLDRHDARVYADFRAQQLVAWAQLEADVIAAERAIGVRPSRTDHQWMQGCRGAAPTENASPALVVMTPRSIPAHRPTVGEPETLPFGKPAFSSRAIGVWHG